MSKILDLMTNALADARLPLVASESTFTKGGVTDTVVNFKDAQGKLLSFRVAVRQEGRMLVASIEHDYSCVPGGDGISSVADFEDPYGNETWPGLAPFVVDVLNAYLA